MLVVIVGEIWPKNIVCVKVTSCVCVCVCVCVCGVSRSTEEMPKPSRMCSVWSVVISNYMYVHKLMSGEW